MKKLSSSYVNTIMGTVGDFQDQSYHGGGKTYPGAVRPFGMVQLSPDTNTGGDNGSGYSYTHNTIEGFSFNHLSGIGWFGDLGNLQVMPFTGCLRFHSGSNAHDINRNTGEGWKSEFDHSSEITEAGYYSVFLDKYAIRAEMTATQRAGILRFTYPASEASGIQIDLARRIGGRSTQQYIRIIDNHTIEGWIKCPPEGGGFGHGDGNSDYCLYFYGQFSKEWDSCGIWNINEDLGPLPEARDADLGFYANYSTFKDEQLLFKAGISYVSIQGAKNNIEAELDTWDFNEVRNKSTKAWENALGNIKILGDDEDLKEIFYTALYHTMLDPREASDVDGKYTVSDKKQHDAGDFTFRTVFSGWDVFRSQFPLLTITKPEVVVDEINTLTEIARAKGSTFPRWELMGNETGCMLGDPGVVIFADAYIKGFRNFDTRAAYELCLRTAEGPASNRRGIEIKDLGYVPELISETLENTYSDFCIYKLALAQGDEKTAEIFKKRSYNYKNIFDASVGWMRRKDAQGNWMPWENKYDQRGCTESNVFQQSWFVPHDIGGLVNSMGKDRFEAELEKLFEGADLSALWNEDYNHSNEPVHHIPHLFNYIGKPWRTQYWVRRIQTEAYRKGPFGFCGNEDVGQMSAWFVLTAMGIHPVAPADGVYNLNTPLFRRMEISLNSKYHKCLKADKLIIETDTYPVQNPYIQKVYLNGQPINRPWITYDEIFNGGLLYFQLGAAPDFNWGINSVPPSLSDI